MNISDNSTPVTISSDNALIIDAYEKAKEHGYQWAGSTHQYISSLKGLSFEFDQFATNQDRLGILSARLLALKVIQKHWQTNSRSIFLTNESKSGLDVAQKALSFLNSLSYIAPKDQAEVLQQDFIEVMNKRQSEQVKNLHTWDETSDLLSKNPNSFLESLRLSDWEAYLQATPNRDIFTSFLDHTFQINIDLFSSIQDKTLATGAVNPLEQNLQYLSQAIGLTQHQYQSLVAYFTLYHFGAKGVYDILENGIDFTQQAFIVDKVIDVPERTTENLFDFDGGVLKNANAFYMLRSKVTEDQKISNSIMISHRYQDILSTKYENEKDFWNKWLSMVTKSDPKSELTEDDFAYLGQDLENLKVALSSHTKIKTLLIAREGTGSTSLLHTLIKNANKKVVSPESHKKEVSLRDLRSETKFTGDSVLLIDKKQDVFSTDKAGLISDLSQPALSTEVWIVTSPTELKKEDIAGFDLVITMPNMPFALRQKLARSLFEDVSLADNIAKSCPTPKLIKQVYEWSQVSKQQSWRELSVVIASMQKTSLSSGTSESDLPIQLYQPDPSGKGFESVVGCSSIVSQAQKIVAGLKNPEAFAQRNIKPPKGVLLTGGPGLGKTHLVRAMAHEAGVPLLVASSSGLAEKPEKITDVFNEAKKQAPCILFLDEIDALGTTSKSSFSPPDPKRQAILNRLLAEIDGFEGLSDVMVIGATHRYEALDEALTRSGRLGWNISFNAPDKEARMDLFHHYMNKNPNIDYDIVARASAGMSPADVSEAVGRAELLSLFEDKDVETKHVLKAIDEINWGVQQDKQMIVEEVYRTAVHEAGHALFAWQQKKDIDRVCVQPTNHALGFVRHFQDEQKVHLTESEAKERIKMLLGGLVAEEVVLGERSFGASSDLQKVRQLVGKMVRVEGMSHIAQAGVSWGMGEEPSETLKTAILEEENRIVGELKHSTVSVMKDNKHFIEALAQHLVQVREISGKELDVFVKQHSHLIRLPNNSLELELDVPSRLKEKKATQGELFPSSKPASLKR